MFAACCTAKQTSNKAFNTFSADNLHAHCVPKGDIFIKIWFTLDFGRSITLKVTFHICHYICGCCNCQQLFLMFKSISSKQLLHCYVTSWHSNQGNTKLTAAPLEHVFDQSHWLKHPLKQCMKTSLTWWLDGKTDDLIVLKATAVKGSPAGAEKQLVQFREKLRAEIMSQWWD